MADYETREYELVRRDEAPLMTDLKRSRVSTCARCLRRRWITPSRHPICLACWLVRVAEEEAAADAGAAPLCPTRSA